MGNKKQKNTNIVRQWHLVDAGGRVLGRMATEIGHLLTGKGKPSFTRYLDNGDHVVIVNAAGIKLTGKKQEQKSYFSHSGYPGGERVIKYSRTPKKKVVLEAVKGMLPQNKLRSLWLKRLYVFDGEEHPYGDKFSAQGGSASGGKN